MNRSPLNDFYQVTEDSQCVGMPSGRLSVPEGRRRANVAGGAVVVNATKMTPTISRRRLFDLSMPRFSLPWPYLTAD